jgi:hypothetical protein
LPVRARALALASIVSASFVLGVMPGSRPEPVAAATPKVAVLVGPTAITDSHYYRWAKELRSSAQAAGATVDLRYCPTPKQAKAATAGANIIVYFGHGNGFPNPYSGTELTDRVNGWGLRDPNRPWNRESCTDSVLRYYGEDYLTGRISGNGWPAGAISPANNFVMVYSNACYAPGAGEARPAPSKDVAIKRVSNYSTPVLRLGGTYFATDLGSTRLVDLLLRNRSTAFGELFTRGNGYSETALRRVAHPAFPSRETWVQRTKSPYLGDDYWYAFAGNPGKAPNGSTPGFSSMPGTMPFTDVADTPWETAITWVYERGVMVDGCGATRFCPRGDLTRGALAQALADGLRLPATSRDFFADDNASRFEDGINRLAAAGLTRGCGDGDYCPGRSVSRGKLADALATALRLPAAGHDYFTDDEGNPHEDAINRIAAAGISAAGCGGGQFCPAELVRRGRAAVFLRSAFRR